MKEEKIRYKVVTADMKSLGLRHNPNIITFEEGKWIRLRPNEIEKGNGDWGGIWVAATKGGARTLQRYMADHYDRDCRIFEARIGKVLHQNSYRIKTDAVYLLGELKNKT